MKTIIIIASLVISIATMASTNVQSKKLQVKELETDTLKKNSVDPVCKMKVKAGNTRTHNYEKVTYGFCSESCRKTFKVNPSKYIKK